MRAFSSYYCAYIFYIAADIASRRIERIHVSYNLIRLNLKICIFITYKITQKRGNYH